MSDSAAATATAPTPVSSRGSWLLLAAALLPAAVSLLMTSSPAKAPPLNLSGSNRNLLFETYLYHYGLDAIEPQAMLYPEFRFVNVGDSPITFTRLEPSCGCLSPRPTNQVVQPGETGAMLLPIRTAGEAAGAHEYLLQVDYEDADANSESLTLTVKVTLPEAQIRVEPKALMVYSNSNVPTNHRIVVTDYRGSRVQITGIESSSSWVSAKLSTDAPQAAVQNAALHIETSAGEALTREDIEQASHTVSGGDDLPRTTIDVSIPAGVPPGRHNAVIRIRTTDAEFETLTVPVLIMGPQSPERAVVSASPPALRIPVTSPDANSNDQYAAAPSHRCMIDVPESWSVSHATADPDSLGVTYEAYPSNRPSMQRIAVTTHQRDEISAQLKTGVVSLHFDDANHLVTIPVTFIHPE